MENKVLLSNWFVDIWQDRRLLKVAHDFIQKVKQERNLSQLLEEEEDKEKVEKEEVWV